MNNKPRCTFEDCDRERHGKGYCKSHYNQIKRGAELAPLRVRALARYATPDEAFWSRVNKTETCWLWTGSTALGYGVFKYDGERTHAHRYSYAQASGETLGGKVIDHLCRVTNCVRPSHLRAASHAQNMQNLGGAQANSASGVRGVYKVADGSGWRAEVRADGTRHAQTFPTLAEADSWARAQRAALHRVPRPS